VTFREFNEAAQPVRPAQPSGAGPASEKIPVTPSGGIKTVLGNMRYLGYGEDITDLLPRCRAGALANKVQRLWRFRNRRRRRRRRCSRVRNARTRPEADESGFVCRGRKSAHPNSRSRTIGAAPRRPTGALPRGLWVAGPAVVHPAPAVLLLSLVCAIAAPLGTISPADRRNGGPSYGTRPRIVPRTGDGKRFAR